MKKKIHENEFDTHKFSSAIRFDRRGPETLCRVFGTHGGGYLSHKKDIVLKPYTDDSENYHRVDGRIVCYVRVDEESIPSIYIQEPDESAEVRSLREENSRLKGRIEGYEEILGKLKVELKES